MDSSDRSNQREISSSCRMPRMVPWPLVLPCEGPASDHRGRDGQRGDIFFDPVEAGLILLGDGLGYPVGEPLAPRAVSSATPSPEPVEPSKAEGIFTGGGSGVALIGRGTDKLSPGLCVAMLRTGGRRHNGQSGGDGGS